MKFITKKGKSLGIGLAMVGSLLVSSLTAPGFVSLLKMKRALAGRHSFPTERGYGRNRRDDQRWSTYHLECPN